MALIEGYDGRPVRVRYSNGSGVPYLEAWEDNVLAPLGGDAWPPALLQQVKSYAAHKSWFAPVDATALAAGLGRISKFQSLNSEDAVTWSWFGTLSMAEPAVRRRVVQWLYDRLELPLRASIGAEVEQWMRVVHPNALSSRNGPELDARIDDPNVALIYVEAKWNAALGTGKGAKIGTKDNQVILRRDSMRVDPALEADARAFVVLGVSNDVPNLDIYNGGFPAASRRPVHIAWVTWTQLAKCDVHPRAAEFRAYLQWRSKLMPAASS